MPALPAVARVVRVDVAFSIPGDNNAEFRKFLQYTGVLTAGDAQTWVSAIHAAFNTRMAGQLYTGCTLKQTTLTDLSSSSAAQAFDATPHAMANANTSLPSGLAMVIKARIARRYRGGHPKTYLPGVPNALLVGGNQWSAAGMAGIIAAWNLWISDCLTSVPIAAAPATEVNVSYYEGFVATPTPSGRYRNIPRLRPGGPVVDVILGHAINSTAASQRRRNETP
jgi:hypothetical protein